MPPSTPIKAPERDPDRPRTLAQAKEVIARLKRQLPGTSGALGLSAPPVPGTVGAPIPKEYPTGPNRPTADPSFPGSPSANLSTMPPKMLAELLERKTLQELQKMLSAENSKGHKTHNPHLAMQIYREIKRR